VRGLALVALVPLVLACGDATAPVEENPSPEPPGIPPAATAWLDDAVVPLEGSHLSLPPGDLQSLRALVGGARIVSLGENTHGTRDFFEMKARILRFLVEEMGFEAFAIEATWPESNRLDAYVRTGAGDPAELLSGLYFWTWNTESVLEMIEWIRSWNEAGGDVGFYGFDMQFPGMALHNVVEYVDLVDPDATRATEDRIRCLARLANGPDGRSPSPGYRDQTDAYRSQCADSLAAVKVHLELNREEYEAASDSRAFALALRSLRVAEQYHLMITGEQSRDQSMAENTVWLAEQLGPDSRLVLWAHNFHVSTLPGAQGSWLRETFGEDMVIVGFSHETGLFTAVRQQGSTFVGLQELTLDAVRSLSYEHYFSTVQAPRFLLDLRDRDLGSEATAWLAGPRGFRSIGCCFDPFQPGRYWATYRLPDALDAVIHFRETRPTVVLPFRYPEVF
jgi:erythromycin esterase